MIRGKNLLRWDYMFIMIMRRYKTLLAQHVGRPVAPVSLYQQTKHMPGQIRHSYIAHCMNKYQTTCI